MSGELRVFVGARHVLRRFGEVVRDVKIYALFPGAPMCVVLLDEDLRDCIHGAFGTGDWLKTGPYLSTGDMAFAARVSSEGALAYIEADGAFGAGSQSSVVWSNGGVVLKPMSLSAREAKARPASLWPVNVALKQLGVVAEPGMGEVESVGLSKFASNQDILERAVVVV